MAAQTLRLVPWMFAIVGMLGCSPSVDTLRDIDPAADDHEPGDGDASDESSDESGDGGPSDGDGGDDEAPTVDAGPVDLHAPSVPTGLRVQSEDPCSMASIAWDPSTAHPDGAPLRGYRLYVNGVHRFTTLTTQEQIQLLSFTYAAGTTYTLTVAAYAEDGAVSAESGPLLYTPATCDNAPEPPANVMAQVQGCREVTLFWEPAVQAGPGEAVSGYEIRRDGVYLGEASSTSYTDFGMSPGESHRYTINTRSNQARASDAVHLHVTLPPCTDTTAPSVPANLRRAPGDSGHCLSADMTWDAASDDEGVHHYNLYRDGIVLEASTDTRGHTDIFMAPSVRYRFEVTAVDASGNESARSNAFAFEPVCKKLTAPQPLRTALLLGNFLDAAQQPFSVAQAEQTVFGAQGSFASYMSEVSFGLIEVSGSAFGWYTLPRGVGSYCPDAGYISCSGHDADLMAAAAGDFGGAPFDRYIRTYAGIGEAGFGGGNSMDLSAGAFDVATIAHEMGHTWGLMHAGDLECSAGEVTAPNLLDLTQGGCVYSRYGDSHDAMGSGNTAYFSTFNKEVLGALGSDQVAVAAHSGTFTLTPAAVAGSGLKELRIPLEVNGFFYFLEYRKPIGFDATGEGVNPVDGVQVRLHSGGGTGDITTQLLHVLINPGSPFYDRYRRIRVEVVEKTEQAVTLRVTR
jgi:hypothetical protein